ncbi:MAG: beta-ketoacyl-[acyl-carrier-protein] synthase family protein [Leptospirales bacterium]|nr:beta-ketoacyl-[acyl-carrier-protein] synthase family protein [Leptospirales bacterium]
MSNRIPVITGIGIISPIGIGKSAFWESLISGQSGFDWISSFDATSFPCKIAAEVRNFKPEDHLTRRQVRYLSRSSQFACAAFQLARDDALLSSFDPIRTDVIIGTATSGFAVIAEQVFKSPTALREYRAGDVDPMGMIKSFIFAPAAAVAYLSRVSGYVSTVSSACASGINAVGLAADRIKAGLCDVAITGGSDTPINHFVLSALSAAGMLNTEEREPASAIRPFDSDRTKQGLGEGSVILVMEEKEHAISRGAIAYAEIAGFQHSTENANELFLLEPSGRRWAEVLRGAVGKNDRLVTHINAHAPGDRHIDAAEASALRAVFGDRTSSIPVASIKGATGQGFSSAGMFQIAAALLSLSTGQIPPTRNCEAPDKSLGLRVSRPSDTATTGSHVLVSAHGVGGVNGALLFKEYAI